MYKIDKYWDKFLGGLYESDFFEKLEQEVELRYSRGIVYPPKQNIYRAFYLTKPDDIKVVIVGQDPYIGESEANGLAFSVNIDKLPPSLKNIYRELEDDLGIKRDDGDLTSWAEQGVFLINRVLTVDKGKSKSHSGIGWENFTFEVIKRISESYENIVFILWGSDARKLKSIIDENKHLIIESVHPSPLSAYRGFFSSKPFSRTNDYLSIKGREVIDWS